MLQEDEIEDLVGDVKLTDSQKSVATTNLYSLDFTDTSSDIKNNSSGKDTYVLECYDSEDSEFYSLHESRSIVNLKEICASHVLSNRDINIENEVKNKKSTEVSTSFHKCSIVAQETFTQTSKTIIELAENDGVLRKSNNSTLETQTSFMSITENKKVEYRIQLSDVHKNFSRNEIVYESDKELDKEEFNVTREQILSNTLEDESSKFPVSETDNDKSDSNTNQSSICDKILLITDEDSHENISSEEQTETLYENSSDYESSRYHSDIEEDSLMERHQRNLENESHSDTSEVENDVAEVYNRFSEKINLKSPEISCEPELRRFGTLTPLTEESAMKKESLLDISPKFIKLIEGSDSQSFCTNNAGINVVSQDYKKEKESFKLPLLQKNQSCPNSPHLNFLFSVNPSRPLSKSGTLSGLLNDRKGRWEIGTKDLASGESPSINGRNGLMWNTSGTVHLPPIHVEGCVVNSTKTDSYPVKQQQTTNTHTFISEQPHDPISIQDKIKELKMCTKNCRSIPLRKSPETSLHSRTASPDNQSQAESRLYDAAERGCEALCAELLKRLRSNAWYEVTDTLEEIPKSLERFWGVIAEHRIADLIRQVSAHIESPRTVVTRTACYTLASILKNTNYTKKPDFYEAMAILLIKTGSYSRPVRRAANFALDDVVCSVELSQAVTALCIHGASHKSALVRSAAARLLVVCSALAGGGRDLLRNRPPSTACARKHVLRALATLLEDKSIDTRKYAERLYSMLRPLTNFEAYYLTDVDVEMASRQMKKFDQMLSNLETR